MNRSVSALLSGLLLAGIIILGLSPGAWAQGPAPAKPDDSGWVRETLPPEMAAARETVPAAPLVAGAYGFIWVAVLVFVGSVAVRTRRLEGDIAALERRLQGLAPRG